MIHRSKIRLFVNSRLGKGEIVSFTHHQIHYLRQVMRKKITDTVSLFNGKDGEWQARIQELEKRSGCAMCTVQSLHQKLPPDLWLLFAPLKKTRTDFIIEKATELGVGSIYPIRSDFTNTNRLRQEKLQSHAIESSEQCGNLYVPPVFDIQPLTKLLKLWPKDRQLLFCDERLRHNNLSDLANLPKGKWAILIGPEGGFSPEEADLLQDYSFVHSISLGPRILRADTAAIVAMTLWQNAIGNLHEYV